METWVDRANNGLIIIASHTFAYHICYSYCVVTNVFIYKLQGAVGSSYHCLSAASVNDSSSFGLHCTFQFH